MIRPFGTGSSSPPIPPRNPAASSTTGQPSTVRQGGGAAGANGLPANQGHATGQAPNTTGINPARRPISMQTAQSMAHLQDNQRRKIYTQTGHIGSTNPAHSNYGSEAEQIRTEYYRSASGMAIRGPSQPPPYSTPGSPPGHTSFPSDGEITVDRNFGRGEGPTNGHFDLNMRPNNGSINGLERGYYSQNQADMANPNPSPSSAQRSENALPDVSFPPWQVRANLNQSQGSPPPYPGGNPASAPYVPLSESQRREKTAPPPPPPMRVPPESRQVNSDSI